MNDEPIFDEAADDIGLNEPPSLLFLTILSLVFFIIAGGLGWGIYSLLARLFG